jgi:subtilisin family serine protease
MLTGSFGESWCRSRVLRLVAGCCIVLVFSVAGVQHATAAAPADAGTAGGIHSVEHPTFGQYLVTLRDVDATQVPAVAARLAHEHGGTVFQVYSHALTGFAVRMDAAHAMALSHDPLVAMVEEDGEMHVTATVTQSPATWGLDRIDQRDLPLNGTYTYSDHHDGAGVTAYILDTGIFIQHQEFGGRASWGVNTVDTTTTDGNGHGTHVAGIVGGAKYGVAKKVNLVAVKVLSNSGSGSTSGIIAGIDWVTANAAGKNAVANMSLGGGKSTTLNEAVDHSTISGVIYVVAAGNDNANTCNYSPASAPRALTVAASDITDRKATFSNWGTCVDLFAPGVAITAAWIGSTTAINTINGTSMAAPYVTGYVAQFLEGFPSASDAEVAADVTRNATRDHLSNVPSGTQNLLLYTASNFSP